MMIFKRTWDFGATLKILCSSSQKTLSISFCYLCLISFGFHGPQLNCSDLHACSSGPAHLLFWIIISFSFSLSSLIAPPFWSLIPPSNGTVNFFLPLIITKAMRYLYMKGRTSLQGFTRDIKIPSQVKRLFSIYESIISRLHTSQQHCCCFETQLLTCYLFIYYIHKWI